MVLLSLFRWLGAARAALDITHTLTCGASRSGKSEAELTKLVSLASKGEAAMVLMDPPGTLASKFLLHLHALGLTHQVIYDRLSGTDRVPGYEWLVPSVHPDPLQREAENEERIRTFASVLLRRRGIQDPARTPLIEEGVLAALRLYLSQGTPCPLPWLAEAFDLRSQARAHLLAHSTEPELVRKFQQYAALSLTARRTETGPAERILKAVLQSPAFRVRSEGATFDLGNFLDEKGILILDGSSQGNLSRDAASVMMGAIILRVIEHCRTGAKSKVVLILDEAMNADLIGVHEARALSEAGKWGLEFHILIQDPFGFPSPEIRSNVLQNCWRHEWFRQGSPEAAQLAAEDIAIPLLDPLRHHHTEYRVREKGTGHETVETLSRSEWLDHQGKRSSGITWRNVPLTRRREVKDPVERYTSLPDQILLMQKKLMLLKPGERFVRGDTVDPKPEYVPMLRHPWSALKRQGRQTTKKLELSFQRTLAALKQRPVYRPPTRRHTSAPPSPPGNGAAKKLAHRGRCRES
jgi:hypothetical protein